MNVGAAAAIDANSKGAASSRILFPFGDFVPNPSAESVYPRRAAFSIIGLLAIPGSIRLQYHPPVWDKLMEHEAISARRGMMGIVNPVGEAEAAPQIQETFASLKQRVGKVPNFFAAMAHRPDVLNAFMPLYAAIVNQGTVEKKYKELAYLRASMVNGCEYCTRAHSVSAKRAGISQEQLEALPFYRRSSLFSEKEKATILYADRVTRAATAIRSAELADLRQHYDEGQIVELTLTICMANFTNRFNDALENIPDIGA